MEGSKGDVKHLVIAKFKDETTPQQIEELIKSYACLVNIVQPMKAFRWGKDVSIENRHEGFTHVFESSFDSKEAIAEYLSHPVHVEFGNTLLTHLDKVLVIDYKSTAVHL